MLENICLHYPCHNTVDSYAKFLYKNSWLKVGACKQLNP